MNKPDDKARAREMAARIAVDIDRAISEHMAQKAACIEQDLPHMGMLNEYALVQIQELQEQIMYSINEYIGDDDED